ncbi:MAG: alpha/beta hydrolase [Alphaproteobacteria bacterium]|nr:alpha/beta hydrolase [Alphaproteobacteria bacterium]
MPQIKANGLSFEYESFGHEPDPAILFIMGFSAQMTQWPVELCTGLASRGYRVIRFDNRDVGLSEKLDRLGQANVMEAFAKVASGQPLTSPYQLNDMAADAAGILDGLHIKDAHIVGASMGGMIAQLVAVNHPAKTRSLTSIMSTTGRPGLPPAKPEAMAALTQPPANLERETRIAHAMKVWRIIGSQPSYAADDAELRASAEREIDRTPYNAAGIARQLVGILASPPRHDMLKDIKAPTLVIHGGDDPLVPVEGGKDTAASIPGARLKIVPGMGHDFTSKLVPVYLREIADFVCEVDSHGKKV